VTRPTGSSPDIPGFTLVEPIGAGSVADVFLYQQQRPARLVAIKVLRSGPLSGERQARFAAEAEALALLSAHPHIVTISTAGLAPDGRPYVVMDHYPGPHLGERARRGDLAVADVLRVGVQVSSAVETAHRAGILHRDLRPANILVSSGGQPAVTDFGIAEVAGFEGERVMALPFTSPEVLAGSTRGSVSADVYGLCATLYCLLAGHAPAWVPRGNNTDAAMTDRILRGEVARLTGPDVPTALRDLLARGLAVDPDERPASAAALADALRAIEQDRALPPTPLEVNDDLATTAGREAAGSIPGSANGGPAREVLAPSVLAAHRIGGEAERDQEPARGTEPDPAAPRYRTPVIVAALVLLTGAVGIGGLLAASRGGDESALATASWTEKTPAPSTTVSPATTVAPPPPEDPSTTVAAPIDPVPATVPSTALRTTTRRPATTTPPPPPAPPPPAPTTALPSELSVCTTGGCAGRARWVSSGDHLVVCDDERDDLTVVAYYRRSDMADRSNEAANRNGSGECTDHDLDIPEGPTITLRVCLTDNGRNPSRCSGWVTGRA
jgi:eukaryotic-like serine/threonine-protein kinase